MIELFEKIDKNGNGFCISNDGNEIRCYLIKRWHPLLIKKIGKAENNIIIEEKILFGG